MKFRKLLFVVGLLALAGIVSAEAVQAPLTAQDRVAFRAMFREGYFGPPRYATAPIACAAATKGIEWYDTANNVVKFCNGSAYVSTSAYAGTTLVPAVSTDLGATATPFRNLYLYGAGTFATTYIKLTGTPTGTRTGTFPDNTGTVAELNLAQAWTAAQDFQSATTGTAWTGTGANTATMFISTPQTFTVADSGNGSAATATLTVTSSVVLVTCSDTDGCTVTMSESGAVSGTVVRIVNLSANAATFADTSGTSELTGSVVLGQYDSLSLVYATDRWVEIAASNN